MKGIRVKRIDKNRVQQHFKRQVDRSVTGKAASWRARARALDFYTRGPAPVHKSRDVALGAFLFEAAARAFARVYARGDLRGQRWSHEKQAILGERGSVEAAEGNPRGISSAACKSPLCSGRGVSVVHRRICISMAYAINRCSRPQRDPSHPAASSYSSRVSECTW